MILMLLLLFAMPPLATAMKDLEGVEWAEELTAARYSSLADLSCRGGVAGDAWLSKSGRTLLVRWPGVPKLLFSPPRFLLISVRSLCASSSSGVGGSGRFGGPPLGGESTALLLPPGVVVDDWLFWSDSASTPSPPGSGLGGSLASSVPSFRARSFGSSGSESESELSIGSSGLIGCPWWWLLLLLLLFPLEAATPMMGLPLLLLPPRPSPPPDCCDDGTCCCCCCRLFRGGASGCACCDIGLKMFCEFRGGCWGVCCWDNGGCWDCWDWDWEDPLPDRGVGGRGRFALALGGGSGTTISR